MVTIVSVAIQDPNGLVFSLPKPKRHNHIVHSMALVGMPTPVTNNREQGFLTSEGNFVTREEAAVIAISCGQVKAEALDVPGVLFSEDVW